MLFDGVSIQRFRILLHPRFELRIGRFALLDVIAHGVLFEAKRGQRHRIETFSNARIASRKLTVFLERNLLPKPREMQNAKWAGDAGTNQWNICIRHNDNFRNPAMNGLQVSAQTKMPAQCSFNANSDSL